MRQRHAVFGVVLTAACLLPRGGRADDDPDDDPAMIIIYDGFGTPQKARLWGRVVEDKGFDKPKKKERWTRRLKRSYRLLESDEIPGAQVALKVAGQKRKIVADKEGLFVVELKKLPLGRHEVQATLVESKRAFRVMTGSVVVVEGRKGGVGVISDVDDTILDTQVKKKLRMLKRVLLDNARSLKTFPTAPALYRDLVSAGMPLIFVSGSPINLYPRLRHFMRIKGFPRGALRLKNLGVSSGSDALRDQGAYKISRIREVMQLLPRWRFVLIGDSGEKDPEIYREVQRLYPGRVVATLIRDVGGAKKDSAKNATKNDSARFAGQLLFSHFEQARRALEKKGLLAKPSPKPKSDAKAQP